MLLSLTKNEILYSHYLFAFEQIKKISNKNEPNYQKIEDICKSLNESKHILNDYKQLQNISLFLVHPLNKCTSKILDIIINTFIEIINDNLIDHSLMQIMSETLINYIIKYLENNETNLKLNQRILNICESIFSNTNLFIHNNSFINIIEICLKIYFIENGNNNGPYKLFNVIINKIFNNMIANQISNYENNKYKYGINYVINKQSSKSINRDKNEIKRKIQLNSFAFFSQKYINFLIDLIEIQSFINNKEEKNIIDKYINIIQNRNELIIDINKDLTKINSFKEELESLNLDNLEIYYNLSDKGRTFNKIGRYGWCILCRKTSNFWSDIINFPVCEDKSCEKEFNNFLESLYSKNDYINMLLILSKFSSSYFSEENNKNKLINLKCSELSLEIIKQMLKKGITYFRYDLDIIFTIKEIFKECIIKNGLSPNPKIFQLCLEIFIFIFNNYKYYLKEQIGTFFIKVIINVLESETREFIFKNSIIDHFSSLLDNSNFLLELYINYDCDKNKTAVFCVLINLFTKILNGLYLKPKYKNIFNNIQENNILVTKSFNFLNKFIWHLNELIDKNIIEEKIKENIDLEFNNSLKNIEDNNANDDFQNKNEISIKNIIEKSIQIFNNGKTINECINYLQSQKVIANEGSFNKIIIEYINDYNNNTAKEDYSLFFTQEENAIMKEIKNYYLSISREKEKIGNEIILNKDMNNLLIFISNYPKEKLPEINYISYIAFEMSNFIRLNIKFLSAQKIKNYLYNENPLNLKIIYYYIFSFDLKNKNLFDSLKIIFQGLPYFSDEKITDIVIRIFGEKFYDENKIEFGNIDNLYYFVFSLLELNNNLNNEEIKHKIELDTFIEKINSLIYGNHKIYDNYIQNIYNNVLNSPFTFLDNKNENKLVLNSMGDVKNKYITKIDNNYIRKMIDFSCGNFLAIYSQVLNDSINNNNKNLFLISIDKILLFAKICGIFKLIPAQTEFINTILNMINLNEKDKLNENMIEIIIRLMNFINENCQNIHIEWMEILQLISKLQYYLLESEENIILNMKNTKLNKFSDKDIKFLLNKKQALSLNISDAVCESIFSKTELFDTKSIINFISDLSKISKQELNSNFIPRKFSLNKLIEVTELNIIRIQFTWIKIWKIISDYLLEIITNEQNDKFWKEGFDYLKLIIGKLLEKEDISEYNFQMEIFRTLEVIFYKTTKIPEKSEIIIDFICYLIEKHWQNIHSGWLIIFRLIKFVYQKKKIKFNDNIKKILKIIYDNKNIIINNKLVIFNEYMEFLFSIYPDKEMKAFSFEIIVGILSKLIDNKENSVNENIKENNLKLIMKLPNCNKIYDYIKIFFYNLDELLKTNIIEYYNLLFEIFNHNKKVLLSQEFNMFIYIYLIYFKPHIVTLLFSYYSKRFNLLNFEEIENQESIIIYSELTNENISLNILTFLEQSINYLMNDLNLNESKNYNKIFYIDDKKDEDKEYSHKRRLLGFLREIKKEYKNGKMNKTINDKIINILKLKESDFELSIKSFFEKFQNIFCKDKEKKETLDNIRYNYFYFDMILSVQELVIFNNNSDLIYRVLYKILSLSMNIIEKENSKMLNDNNLFILKVLSNTKIKFKNEEDIYKFIKYCLDFCNYFLDFIELYQIEILKNYNLISKLFNKVLLVELENNFEKYKITSSSSTIVLLIKLQDIQLFILNKINDNNYKEVKNKDNINILINLNKIYDKYQIEKEENSLINKIFIFELENILPKLLQTLNNGELETIYECLTNLINSINHNIRNGAKNILKFFLKHNFINLNNSHINK